MKERPIIFTGHSVRATLDDLKTQTRRVIKPQPWTVGDDVGFDWSGDVLKEHLGKPYMMIGGIHHNKWERQPYKLGQRLWVKETWLPRNQNRSVLYKAEYDPVETAGIGALYGGWKNPRYMPRWASRITLEVTSIRVERVQEITEDDAIAEGSYLDRCSCLPRKSDRTPMDVAFHMTHCREHGDEYKTLWDTINAKRDGGKYSWASNPWVWVIEFKKI